MIRLWMQEVSKERLPVAYLFGIFIFGIPPFPVAVSACCSVLIPSVTVTRLRL